MKMLLSLSPMILFSLSFFTDKPSFDIAFYVSVLYAFSIVINILVSFDKKIGGIKCK